MTQPLPVLDSQRRFAPVEKLLSTAESSVALLARCQPLNVRQELERLLPVWRAGGTEPPRFSYHQRTDLSAIRHGLAQVIRELQPLGALEGLYAARAEELLLEARIVEAVGTRQVVELASQRFSFKGLAANRLVVCDDGATDTAITHDLATEALQLAQRWVTLDAPYAEPTVPSDAANDPCSLLSLMQRCVGSLRLPIRVEVCNGLSANAAAGDGVILITPGRALTQRQARRIVVHEVFGHALPRYRAREQALGLFRVGSARGNDEQEGYALFLEAHADLLDPERQRELGLRHLAALSVEAGADWVETTRLLLDLDCSFEQALPIASRVHRAGGLARERIYLPALCRVTAAATRDPEVLNWFTLGRLSLEAIATLRELRGTADLRGDRRVIRGFFLRTFSHVDVHLDAAARQWLGQEHVVNA